MNFSLCSNPSEMAFASPCLESSQSVNINKPLPLSSIRASDFTNKESNQVSNCDARKTVLSCQHVPGQLEGTRLMGKPLSKPRQKLEFVRTLLIDNYDSYTYNIYQELSVVNGLPPIVVHNDEWTWEEACYYIYEKRAFDNIVISPGPGSPACPADIGICLKLLLECKDIPILGVCLGHQALGYVHGAEVIHAFEPVHGRLSEIQHNGCRLFHDIPSGKNSGFKVVRYHSLVIDAKSLPKELIPLAWTCSSDTTSSLVDQNSDFDANQLDHQTSFSSFSKEFKNGGGSWCSNYVEGIMPDDGKVLMGIMHSTRPHYGLQFHPESIATCHGSQIFKNFREITEDFWGGKEESSSISERKLQYDACMQVRNGSWRFKNNPRSNNLPILDTNHFNMCKMVNSSNLTNGVKFFKLEWRKLEHLSCQVGGEKNIFLEVFGDEKAGNTFWLDSSSTEKGRARFSFMGGKGSPLWKQITFRVSEPSEVSCTGGGHITIEDAQGSSTTTFLKDGFFHFMDKELQSIQYDEKDYEGLPFEFYGGYVGYLGYGLKVECGVPYNRHKAGTPDACFFFADNLIIIDHSNDDIYLLSLHDQSIKRKTWLDDIEQKLMSLKASAPKTTLSSQVSVQAAKTNSVKAGFLSNKTREQYMQDVEKCQKFIKDGESYELCLTNQMRKKISDIDLLGLYFHLRDKNPAPYAAWLNFSNENLTICCSSPERFLSLDRDGILEAKPIKGTIARGLTPEEDELLRSQLQHSEKDQAENLMIVDLLRNDLGRVCEAGSVHVPRLMEVESYATVHTMVSTIRGKKEANLSAIDCVRAAFPGGSMTGAPKLRSMELLDSLETCSRGIYSGCIGFFSYNQTFDLNIVIRTVVVHEGEVSVGAGGAVVALSSPEEEYKEMVLKARAPMNAVVECEDKFLENKCVGSEDPQSS